MRRKYTSVPLLSSQVIFFVNVIIFYRTLLHIFIYNKIDNEIQQLSLATSVILCFLTDAAKILTRANMYCLKRWLSVWAGLWYNFEIKYINSYIKLILTIVCLEQKSPSYSLGKLSCNKRLCSLLSFSLEQVDLELFRIN